MIPLNDLKRDYYAIGGAVRDALHRVQERGQFILGEELAGFEREFAAYTGSSYCIGVNSGSDALLLALQVLGVTKGDEVILPSHTFIATADAVIRNGATPVFADIDPATYCLDISSISKLISPRTRVILTVHLYGHPVDMAPIVEVARENDITVVEDSCQAHGSEYKGKKVGSIGSIGCFSFYPGKNLGAYGDAGCMVTNNKHLCERMQLLRNYGGKKKYVYKCTGMNSRMDEIQAAVLRVKLAHLDYWNNNRRHIAHLYENFLDGCNIIRPVERSYAKHVYHLYVVRTTKRDKLRSNLKKKGIETGIHYPIPVHKQYSYRKGNYPPLPITEKFCKEILSLPMNPWMDDDTVRFISEVVVSCL
jgi:dTDP-4-amino-4,6-dideoxygalactose transaminase